MAVVADGEDVSSEFETEDLEHDDGAGGGGGEAHDFGVEGAVEAGEEGGEEDVGYHGHDGDVHVWGVEVGAGGEEVVCVC